MNGFSVMADSYRKMVSEGKITSKAAESDIRIYDFLGKCNKDDFYRLFDTSAFNDILKAYTRAALKNADLDEDTIRQVMNELRFLLEEKCAKEVCEG